jgi:3-oxoacyl-[acyl-carrier protein] reductase
VTAAERRFANRVAVVTGGASGIGRAVALRLVAEGAWVALWDIDGDRAAALEREAGASCFAQRVDVTQEDEVAAALAATEARLGPVDILVTSAGITGPVQPLAATPLRDWERVLRLDLTAVFLCCRAVVPGMEARDRGRIVNIASIAGKEGNPNLAPYSAAKAGVIGLTKALGRELAGTQVRVNCVAPAAVETELFRQMTPEYLDFIRSKIPVGRFGQVDEVAAMVCWLASDEASFSTGAVFDLSGGRATY